VPASNRARPPTSASTVRRARDRDRDRDIAADGTFRIRAAPGSNYVYLRCTGEWKAVAPAACDVEVVAGKTVKVEFRVRRAGW